MMGILMDSRTPQEPKPDAEKNLAIGLLKLLAPPNAAKDLEDRLRAGGLGYGDLKKALFEQYWAYFAEARRKRAELAGNPGDVRQVLREGASRARTLAQTVLKRARTACGLESIRKHSRKKFDTPGILRQFLRVMSLQSVTSHPSNVLKPRRHRPFAGTSTPSCARPRVGGIRE